MGVSGISDSLRRLPETRAALDYARRAHAGQSREGNGAPFIAHPYEVASLLLDSGAPDHVIAAGALHDVIEKTPVHAHELRKRFGSRIAALVLAVSEDQRITGYAARKAALRSQVASASDEALMIFAADKISQTRALLLANAELDVQRQRGVHARGSRMIRPRDRLAHYRRCLSLLQQRLPDSPLVGQLDCELQNLSVHASARAANATAT